VETLKSVGGDGLYVDGAHLTAEGNRIVAEQIAEYLLSKGW